MKYRKCSFKTTLILINVGVFCLASSVWAGTITGHLEAKGVKGNQDAVVYVDTIEGKEFDPSVEPVLSNQLAKEFVPHVLPILKGTTVDFLNSDAFTHNVFSPDEAADEFNLGSWGQGEKRAYTFSKLGEAVILCNLHPEMEGWIVVLPTPYFAVTDENGDYTIENVPEGTYTLKTWHKKLRPSQSEVTVSSSDTSKIDFTIKK